MKGLSFIQKAVRRSSLCLLLMVSAQHAVAQQDAERSEYTGTGMAIEDVGYPDFNTATRVMLYNVGKDMFLNAGGYWGTRTATFTVGLPLVFEPKEVENVASGKTAQCYRIQGPFNNTPGSGQGNSLGFVHGFTGDEEQKNGLYFDREYGNKAEGGETDWWLEKVATEDGDNVYQIKTTVASGSWFSPTYTTYTLCANNPMTIRVYQEGNNNLVKALSDKEIEDGIAGGTFKKEHTYWKIVSESAMEALFDNNYYKKKPADATFLMRAQGFNRTNRFIKYDSSLGRGWQTEGSLTYSTDWPSGMVPSTQQGGQNFEATFGMFYCADIKDGKKGGKLYQKVTLRKTGWYTVECQGFYNDKKGSRNPCGALYARFADAADINTPGWSSAPLRGKSAGENEAGIGTVNFNAATFRLYPSLADDIDDGKISNKVEAGVAFYSLIYPNQVMIYANIPEGKSLEMELGIEITDDMDSDDYIYVDDFRLRYLGESFALNENWDDFRLSSDNATYDYELEYPNHVMILKREMTTGKWNTICLPVNLTKAQLQGTFSANVKLAKLTEGLGKDGTIEFILVNLNKAQDDDIVLHCGEAYLINPGEGNHWNSGEISIGDAGNDVLEAPFYMISRVTLKKKDLLENEYKNVFVNGSNSLKKFSALKYDDNGESYEQDVKYAVEGDMHKDCGLRVYATFESQLNETEDIIPRNAYVFSGGKIYHLNGTYAQKGYSWWIEDEDQDPDNPSATRHALSFATYMNGISDNTATAIEGIPSGAEADGIPLTVCSISGQAVRHGTSSVEGLAGGVYIVGGRKVVVR
ncbi:MAG: hypothetical protein NC344_02990 [Bacteroidales bacterium]|nr:hypothetical protein [Bacteroidales bacterium]MCM1146798.1 hypothetical protein [Bacteroidales bacterium]MCM1205705.1 hypothetical protein [Bacillota bacterium]MCM1510765.1 hypothetical protein [Clostridium sp.]